MLAEAVRFGCFVRLRWDVMAGIVRFGYMEMLELMLCWMWSCSGVEGGVVVGVRVGF